MVTLDSPDGIDAPRSKDKLQRELKDAGIISSLDLAECAAAQGIHGIERIYMVQHVKCLAAQLQRALLRDSEFPRHTHVDAPESGTEHRCRVHIPIGTQRGLRERRRVQPLPDALVGSVK